MVYEWDNDDSVQMREWMYGGGGGGGRGLLGSVSTVVHMKLQTHNVFFYLTTYHEFDFNGTNIYHLFPYTRMFDPQQPAFVLVHYLWFRNNVL